MAGTNFTELQYKGYNGAWHAWNKTMNGAYAHTDGSKYGVVIALKAPTFTGTSYNVDFTMVYIRQLGTAKSGNFYIKWWGTTDPSTGSTPPNTISGYTAVKSWSCTNQQVQTLSFNFTTSGIQSGQWHYISIGCDKIVEVGYSTNNASKWSGSFDYYASIGGGSVGCTDNGNNTYTVTGTGPANAHNNAVTSAVFKWTKTDGTLGTSTQNNTSSASFSATENVNTDSTANTKSVTVKLDACGARSDPGEVSKTFTIRRYKAPGAPNPKPALTDGSYKNNRLTIKLPWTYEWGVAPPGTGSGTTNGTGANQTTSVVKGYRVRLMRKPAGGSSFNTIAIKTNASTTITTHNTSEGHHMDITNPDTRSVTIDPVATGIVPGDKVKFQVKPFTKYGATNAGSQLFGTYSESDEKTVQNAGVMRVRPTSSSGWKEGVVWVKVNKNGTVQWVEADVVKYKTANGWKESV